MVPALDSVRSAYRRQLIHQTDALLVARKALLDGQSQVRASIQRIAHNLNGSGGSFGFPEVSTAARAVCDASDDSLYVAIDDLLAELRRAAVEPDARHRVVLVVEDEPTTQALLHMIVSPWADKVVGVQTAHAARVFLKKQRPSLILLDLMLPDLDGRAFLMELRSDATLRKTPIVVLSSTVNTQIRSECLALGAVEVHEKPVDPVSLSTCVAAMCGYESRSTLQVRGDPITGLLDRDMFREAARQVRKAYDLARRPWAILFFELAEFEAIAQECGQKAAEEALCQTATILRNLFAKPEETASRWDEGLFVVLCPNDLDTRVELNATLAIAEVGRMQIAGWNRPTRLHAGGVRCGAIEPHEALVVARRMIALAREAQSEMVVMSSLLPPVAARKVLIADDDPSMRDLLGDLLSSPDHDLVIRDDGVEALAALRQMTFDAVILDIDMPGHTGLEIVRHMRSGNKHKHTPVMFLTSYGQERQIVEGFEAGANDYVTKPFQSRVLQMRLRSLFTRR